jgi:hypothetical protein
MLQLFWKDPGDSCPSVERYYDQQQPEDQQTLLEDFYNFLSGHGFPTGQLSEELEEEALEISEDSEEKSTDEEGDGENPSVSVHSLMLSPPPPPPPPGHGQITITSIMGELRTWYLNNASEWAEEAPAKLARAIGKYEALKRVYNQERTLATAIKENLQEPLSLWVTTIGNGIKSILPTPAKRSVLREFLGMSRESGTTSVPSPRTPPPQGPLDVADLRARLAERERIKAEIIQQAKDRFLQTLPLDGPTGERAAKLNDVFKAIRQSSRREQTLENLQNLLKRSLNLTSDEEAQAQPCLNNVIDILCPTNGGSRAPDSPSSPVFSPTRLRPASYDPSSISTQAIKANEMGLNPNQKQRLEELLEIEHTISRNRNESALTRIQMGAFIGALQTLERNRREYHGQTVIDHNVLVTFLLALENWYYQESYKEMVIPDTNQQRHLVEIFNLDQTFWSPPSP